MDDRLKRALDQFDLERYVHQTFDPVLIGSGGTELRVNCFSPDGCNGSDTKQHLWINPEKKAWICYKCGYGDHRQQSGTGFIPRFMADAEGEDIQKIINRLQEGAQPTPDGDLEEMLEALFDANAASLLGVVPDRIDLPGAFITCPDTLSYLKSRGIELEDIRKYDLRYSGTTTLRLWRHRIVFPVRDQFGVIRSAVGRHILGREPRWVNWPKTDVQQLLWPLGEWHHGKWVQNRSGLFVLTEGVLDALGAMKAGADALCTFGHKLSDRQVEVIQDLRPDEVMLAWDWDARDKMVNAIDRLVGRFKKVSVFPFLDARWLRMDFGDMLVDHALRASFRNEVDHRIDVEASEYVKWETSVRLG